MQCTQHTHVHVCIHVHMKVALTSTLVCRGLPPAPEYTHNPPGYETEGTARSQDYQSSPGEQEAQS